MKFFIMLGLIFGFSANADEVATETMTEAIELETICLTDETLVERTTAGWLCTAMIAEDGTEMLDTLLCTMAVAEGEEAVADVMLTTAACEMAEETATE